MHQSTLVVRINRLEADLALPLFERAERGTAMKLTGFVKRCAAAGGVMAGGWRPRWRS
ncbi:MULTISPECIES: LysR family transcriptional regulator [unclassified Streptomyces]|uniref:helix-turn-helix domain-containing protein n=1 Tax=unclassified Streptomyces TaxID=2593676 RepID=UPI0036E565CF